MEVTILIFLIVVHFTIQVGFQPCLKNAILSKSSFQRRGPETAKALSPYDLVLVAITSKYSIDADLKDLADCLNLRRSVI